MILKGFSPGYFRQTPWGKRDLYDGGTTWRKSTYRTERTKPDHKTTAKPDVLLEVCYTSWKFFSHTCQHRRGCGAGLAEFAVLSFVITGTHGTSHSRSCPEFLAGMEGRVVSQQKLRPGSRRASFITGFVFGSLTFCSCKMRELD